MGDVVQSIINWVVPFLCGAVAGALTLWFTGQKALRDGVQCLLRGEIIRQNEKWTERGFCPIYAKQALTREYCAYHALKGNDVATSLYRECMNLPERKEDAR